MKIVICLKQIVHTYARTGRDPEKQYLSDDDRIYCINPCDELAVGMALRARYFWGGGDITLLTLGPLKAESELRRCLAMGANHLCQIDMAEPMDSRRKSVFLGRAIKEIGADLVLCGTESMDTRNGQVAARLAHFLGIPFVSSVREVINAGRGTVRVKRSADRGIKELVEFSLPAVLSVDTGAETPEMPAYEEKKRSWDVPIQKIIYDMNTVPAGYTHLKTYPPRPRPKILAPPDSRLPAYERISQLLSGRMEEKKGEMLAGDPESQAEGIITFLKKHGILEDQED